MNSLYDEKYSLVREFAFATAVSESQELRTLVKNKALEMFDSDYEVLFFYDQRRRTI
ncbi:MAG: hypothetical protein ACJAZY_002477 [Spirosomataceae bacterium]|jgi:hypothetical protein